MADPTARALAEALRAAGMSGSTIARAIGRDPGMINQILRGARGPGYGAHLIGALESMVARLATTGSTGEARQAGLENQPTRRQTKAGQPARWRQPALVTPAGTNIVTAEWGLTQLRALQAAAAAGLRVTLVLLMSDGSYLTYWPKGGYAAARFLGDLQLAAAALLGRPSDHRVFLEALGLLGLGHDRDQPEPQPALPAKPGVSAQGPRSRPDEEEDLDVEEISATYSPPPR